MFDFLTRWVDRLRGYRSRKELLAPGQPLPRRVKRPSEEDHDAEELERQNPDRYVSDSFTDPSTRGGPLGSGNEMPEGGDSTRGMSKGPASKSPMPERPPSSEKRSA